DGIRDRTVTGVQTCALPISARLFTASPRSISSTRSAAGTAHSSRKQQLEAGAVRPCVFVDEVAVVRAGVGACSLREKRSKRFGRSEERRVGKECGARGGTCQ